MTQTKLSVEKRSDKKPKKLRQEGILPANVYGNVYDGDKSQSIEIPTKVFKNLYAEIGETGVVSLVIGNSEKTRAVMVDEVQIDALSGDYIHVTFKEVSLKEKLTAMVPVEVIGEFGVSGGVLVTVRDEIEVEALPTDLPEKFEISLDELTEVGQSITLKDLKFDASKVSLVIGDEGEDAQVVTVQEQKEEEPEPVVEEISEEGEDGETTEDTSEEGEEKVEGEEEKTT